MRPGQPGKIHPEYACNEGRWKKSRSERRERIELAIGLGGELGITLSKASGAHFQHLKILIQRVKPCDQVMKTLGKFWNGPIGQGECPAHRAHMPVQQCRLTTQEHEAAPFAAMTLVENVVF